MRLSQIVQELQLRVFTQTGGLEADVARGYASDLLSDVIGNAEEGDVWITLQAHQNIVGVAVMKSLAAIILIGGREPEEKTVAKANEEEIPVLGTELTAFDLVARLAGLGLKGS